MTPCDWRFDNIGINTTSGDLISLAEYLSNKNFDFVINAPMMVSGANRVASFLTPGYRMRRLAVEHAVPLVTDVKCAKLLIEVYIFVYSYFPFYRRYLSSILILFRQWFEKDATHR